MDEKIKPKIVMEYRAGGVYKFHRENKTPS